VLETTHPSIGYAVFMRDFKTTYEQRIDAMQAQLQTGKVLITRQSEQLSEQQLQLDRLVVDRDTQLETVASLSQNLEAQALELAEVREKLSQMEAAQADAEQGKLALQGRQTHLHDDLVRAEAQIDLIKELMFTPPSLQG
jgi:chromosome segregation ATPase